MCQIIDMNSIPDFAAVNETVKLARHNGERAFINAVLRETVRVKDSLPYPDRAKSEMRYLSVRYSIPLGTVKLLSSLVGEDTERLLRAFAEKSALSLTVNTRRVTREELISRFSELGAHPSRFSPNGIELDRSVPPTALKGFAEGDFFVQDEASRVEAMALDAREGDVVVDVCAAPGGKTLAAAITVGDTGKVYSFDLHASKLSLIEDSVKRLGLSSVIVAERDATHPDESLFGMADRVICDVPCSGLGVIGKKPDLRYKEISCSEELVPIQSEILRCSAKYLKVGGIIVYSTCTLNPAENEGVVSTFLSENPEFSLVPFCPDGMSASDVGLTLLPHEHGTDGFYIAKLRKNK
jgi:16S rRNA (cytosine967-C5)-methyltransferase